MSSLVAYPACLAAYSPHYNIRKHVVDGVAKVWNVVECLRIINCAVACRALTSVSTAIVAGMVATRSTIEPHLKLVGTVLGQFHTLWEEHLLGIAVGIVALLVLLAPILAVEVPRRHIEAILHAKLAGSTGEVAWNVGLAGIFGRTVRHTMCGSLGWPQTESVVMLNHSNAAFHASRLSHT